MKDKDIIDFSLTAGNTNPFSPDRPVISIVGGEGHGVYLWVGNNGYPMWCFATLFGTKRLSKLAHGILRAIGEGDKP